MVLTKPTNEDDDPSDLDDDSMDTDEGRNLLCASLLASHRWLLKSMPALPHFDAVRGAATTALRGACQVETDPRALSAYVVFLSLHAPASDLNDLAVVSKHQNLHLAVCTFMCIIFCTRGRSQSIKFIHYMCICGCMSVYGSDG